MKSPRSLPRNQAIRIEDGPCCEFVSAMTPKEHVELRESLGLTRRAFARRFGVSIADVRRRETAARRAQNVLRSDSDTVLPSALSR
jgi:DNA-binding transcriptional regulator YiaG